MKHMAWIVALMIMVLALGSAEAAGAAPLARELHPLGQQTSDEVIAADLALVGQWRAKLDSLPGAERDLWRMHAARAWLGAASAEYADNDRTGFPQAAFARAVGLIEEIERHAEPASWETVPTAVPPAGSTRVADSLYVALEKMKRDLGFLCAAEPLANLEVQLAWTGNEQLDQGDCKSSPHSRLAEALAGEARGKVETCGPPLLAVRPGPPPPPPAPVADTVLVPKIIVPTVEELKIPRSVHFALNQFSVTPESRRVIAGIAALLVKYPSVTARLEGHTDSRGDAAYNLKLSQRRVMAVRTAFLDLGIDSTRLTTSYKGKAELSATENSKRGHALNRRVEMVFVDSEGRDIKGTTQEGDLQLEGDRKAKPAPKKAVHKKAAPKRPKSAAPHGAKSGTKPAAKHGTGTPAGGTSPKTKHPGTH